MNRTCPSCNHCSWSIGEGYCHRKNEWVCVGDTCEEWEEQEIVVLRRRVKELESRVEELEFKDPLFDAGLGKPNGPHRD